PPYFLQVLYLFQLLFEFRQCRAMLVEFFAFLVDHLGWRLVGKAGIFQLAFDARHVLLEAVDLLAEAFDLRALVDQAGHRYKDLHATHQLRRRRWCRSVGIQPDHLVESRQAAEEAAVAVETALVLFVAIVQVHGQFLARRNAHFAADVAHRSNHALEPLDVLFGLGINTIGGYFRIARQHHRIALYAGEHFDALPDFLGDERHERMRQAQDGFQHTYQCAARAALL